MGILYFFCLVPCAFGGDSKAISLKTFIAFAVFSFNDGYSYMLSYCRYY